jgi:hypothetical protein
MIIKSIFDFKIQEFRDGIPAGRIPGTVYITPIVPLISGQLPPLAHAKMPEFHAPSTEFFPKFVEIIFGSRNLQA